MDERLQITDAPRAVAPGVTADTPPTTLAWRALRAEHQRRVEEHRAREAESARVRETLAVVAEEVHRLRRAAESATAEDAEARARQLQGSAARLTDALARAGVRIVAPEGEPYTSELMELLENVARQPDPLARTPRVAEVITPAVTYDGRLLRMGRAVIAVPAGEEEEEKDDDRDRTEV